jgi:hypothetical protein
MVEFVISNVVVNSGVFEFELLTESIYSLQIATDPNRLIIEDEFGGRLRILPTDDTLRIYSTRSTYRVTPACNPRRICSKPYTACCYPAPRMGAGTVTHILADGSELVIAEWVANSAGATSQKVNMQIQRGEIYRFEIGSPTKAIITFKTPETKQSFTFYCKGLSTTSTTGLGYCNFQQSAFQQTLRDTLTAEPITFIGAPNG